MSPVACAVIADVRDRDAWGPDARGALRPSFFSCRRPQARSARTEATIVVPTRFITVRFGNVLVDGILSCPCFVRQIEAGGPVTVTTPADMRRYFMTCIGGPEPFC